MTDEATPAPGQDLDRLYSLGTTLEKHQEFKQASWVYAQALALDPDTRSVDEQLLASESKRFQWRRTMARFVEERLPEIRRGRDTLPVEADTAPKIYVYWEQGFESAPPIVRTCHAELRRLHGDAVVDLDREKLRELVDIPADVRLHTEQDRTAFSDIARVALLHRYGGVWIDATCLPSASITERYNALVSSGFFAFRYHKAHISSWFLAARPGDPVCGLMFQGLCELARSTEVETHYYRMHHMFEAMYYLDEEFRAVWDATEKLSSYPPHELQKAMHEEYCPERLEELLGKCFVHKLTYKQKTKSTSILAHLEKKSAPPEPPKPAPRPAPRPSAAPRSLRATLSAVRRRVVK